MQRLAEYLGGFAALDWLNIALALACTYLAALTAVKLAHAPDNEDLTSTVVRLKRSGVGWWDSFMTAVQHAETRALVCAEATFAVGAFGYFLGQMLSRWQTSFDLLLFGGAAALHLINRRRDSAYVAKSLIVTASVWVLFLLTVQRVSV